MEIIVMLITALIGGIFYFKRKADKVEQDKKIVEAKAQDKALREYQDELERQIAVLDAGIKKMKQEKIDKDAKRKKYLTLKERSEKLKKGLK